MASNNYIYKMSNAGGMATITRYTDMLAGNATWNPWEPQGAYDALATVTVPSGGVASVTFAAIPSTYKHLQIRGFAQSGGSGFMTMRANGDSANNYDAHEVYGNGSSAGAAAFVTRSSLVIDFVPSVTNFGAFILDILDYTSTSKNKTIRCLCGFDANGSGNLGLVSGLWRNSSTAISSLELFPQSGVIAQHSQFTLYGIR
jgi:hypothetical protein